MRFTHTERMVKCVQKSSKVRGAGAEQKINILLCTGITASGPRPIKHNQSTESEKILLVSLACAIGDFPEAADSCHCRFGIHGILLAYWPVGVVVG